MFYYESMLDLLRAIFLHQLSKSCEILLFYWCGGINWFSCVEPSFNFWDKTHLVIVWLFILICCHRFNMLSDLVCLYFVEYVCISFSKVYWSVVFLWSSCLMLGLRKRWPPGMSWEVFPHLLFFFFLMSSRRIQVNSLNVWKNSPVKPSCPGLVLVGRYLMIDSISMLVWFWSEFLVLNQFQLVSMIAKGTKHFAKTLRLGEWAIVT